MRYGLALALVCGSVLVLVLVFEKKKIGRGGREQSYEVMNKMACNRGGKAV